jgi:hypothetical protein
MEELHLVLHKVKGRPAIDVAQRLLLSCGRELWFVPTSGPRVYPYKCVRLDESLAVSAELLEGEEWQRLPDHYAQLEQRKQQRGLRGLIARVVARLRRPRPSVADALDRLLWRSLRQRSDA